jgi:glucokinase
VIAIDFGGTKVDVAWADAHGVILGRQRLATHAADGPDQALLRTSEVVDQFVRTARKADCPVGSVAAVAPGVVRDDGILLVPNLPGWEDLALAHRLAELLEMDRVPVWNDVRAGALAELRHGSLRDADPGLYVSLGTGVAAAVTVGGAVVEGAHQAAGEVAYLLVDHGPVPAAADGTAQLEAIIGGRALGDRASAYLGETVDAAGLFARTDPEAQQLVHHALGVLADAVVNMAVLLDPARVVVGGGMMASADLILRVLAARLNHAVPFPPQVAAAHFTQDASLHGAIALAVDALDIDALAVDALARDPRSRSTRSPLAQGAHR